MDQKKKESSGPEIPSLCENEWETPLYSVRIDPSKSFPEGLAPYPHQIEFLVEAGKFFRARDERILLNYIPTAGGKSPLAVSVTRAWIAAGGRSVILCPNKELQFQYRKDFGDGGLNVVMGASEFSCASFPGESCGSVSARKTCAHRKIHPVEFKGGCPCPYKAHLEDSRRLADVKPLCFTPMSLLAYRKNSFLGPTLPSGNGLLVVDEAHLLPDTLSDMLAVSVRLDVLEGIRAAARWVRSSCDGGGSFGEASFSGGYGEGEGGDLVPKDKEGERVGFVRSRPLTSGKNPPTQTHAKGVAENKVAGGAGDGDFFFLGKGPTTVNHEGLPLGPMTPRRGEILEEIGKDAATLAGWLGGLTDATIASGLLKFFPIGEGASEGASSYLYDFFNALAERCALCVETMGETQWACELTRLSSHGLGDDLFHSEGHREKPTRLLIRPGVIPNSFLKKVFGGFSKVILMSGTLFRTHLERLGLVSAEMVTEDGKIVGVRRFEADSRIPIPRRRMVIDHGSGMSVNHSNISQAFEKFANYIVLEIAPKLPGAKGIIHVSSAVQAEKLADYCNRVSRAHAKRNGLTSPTSVFLTPKNKGWRDTYQLFRDAPTGGEYGENLFLIAARRYEGLDLRDDLARINIIAKTPYPNIKDSVVCSLDELFRTYSVTATLTSFIQAANRAVRHPGDWALNICLDTSAALLFARYGEDMPSYVKDAISEEREKGWLERWEPPT